MSTDVIQADIDFTEHPFAPIWPTAKKTYRILEALRAGRHLTVGTALKDYGVYALSQECGRLRKLGWPIQDRLIEVSPGVRVKEYWL